jgi:CubicO group peptidase (beta-lactamase class C family)
MQKKINQLRLIFFIVLITSLGCNDKSEKKPLIQRIFRKKAEKPLSEKEVSKKVEQLDEYFLEMMKKRGLNGVALVAKGNQIILRKSYGYLEFKHKTQLPENSVFQLASVSKQFTAAAIMLLHQKGLLNYEDTVQKFFDDFPYHNITIRQLLTHNSGLTNYTYFCDKVWDRKKPIDNENVICLMSEFKPPAYFNPGVRYNYSNTGYMILASIVEKVSKMKFEQFMKKYLFLPTKMNNTYIYNHNTPIDIRNMVDGYNYGRRPVGKTYLDGVFGDKGVYSNVDDLYKWSQVLFTDTLFSKKTMEEAFTPAFKERKNKDNYGFGWRIKDYHGDKVVWHGGWWEGYKTMFIRNLKDEVTIIVLTNSLGGHLKSTDLLDVYYNKVSLDKAEGPED